MSRQHRASEPTDQQKAEAREAGGRIERVVAGARMGHAVANTAERLGETPPSKAN